MASTAYKAMLGTAGGVVTDDSDGLREREAQLVWLWDIGPEKPVQPKRPIAPKGREGDPEFELAIAEFQYVLDAYKTDLERFRLQKIEHDEWSKRGGPIQIMQWSCDASTTLAYDKEAVDEGRQSRPRYYVSSRTRGYKHLPNTGLPDGVMTGQAWKDQLRREREGDEEISRARKEDPVFGERQVA